MICVIASYGHPAGNVDGAEGTGITVWRCSPGITYPISSRAASRTPSSVCSRAFAAASSALFWLGGAVVMAAVVAALFVLPVRDWFAQDEALAEKRSELAVLEQTNAELAAANARLQTDDGVREAAREEIGYVMPGEQRQTVMPVPSAPATLPAGWPYDAISQIIAVQSTAPLVP
jgi:hypothetical protein